MIDDRLTGSSVYLSRIRRGSVESERGFRYFEAS